MSYRLTLAQEMAGAAQERLAKAEKDAAIYEAEVWRIMLGEFFDENPDVESISVNSYSEYNDEGGYYMVCDLAPQSNTLNTYELTELEEEMEYLFDRGSLEPPVLALISDRYEESITRESLTGGLKNGF